MLPSSHLAVFESPDQAAERIAREQLGSPEFRPPSPLIVSETYHRAAGDTDDPHWDLHFIYRSTVERAPPGSSELWEELRFLEPRQHAPEEFARAQSDILAFAGHPTKVGRTA
ncbi:MAG: hypothetical protein L3K15_01690 [Thermoplasmata archaeon]|nr:hypothetical protein [Thermoplasmata archaeon]